MPNRVDTAMDHVQPLRLDTPPDRSPADATAEQLPASDHPMLRPSELGDPLIPSSRTFDIYLMLNVRLGRHGTSVAQAPLRVGHGRNVWAT
jgi:hypothetical protein